MSRAQNVAAGAGRTAPSGAVPASSRTDASFKDALLAEIKKSKAVFYNMVVAQAQKIEVAGDRVTFTFSSTQRALCDTVDQHKAWLEGLAQQLAGRRMAVVRVQAEAVSPAQPAPKTETPDSAAIGASPVPGVEGGKKSTLREQALADAGVQALLEVFPAEIRDVEEM